MKIFYKECHNCGFVSVIEDMNTETFPQIREEAMKLRILVEAEDQNGKIITDADGNPVFVDYNQICVNCGAPLVESPLEISVKPYDGYDIIYDKRVHRIKENREYYLYKKYVKGNPQKERAFLNGVLVPPGYNSCKDYWRDCGKRSAWEIIGKVLLGIILFIPVGAFEIARGLLEIGKKSISGMADAKGSTIIFWNDCNHHHK